MEASVLHEPERGDRPTPVGSIQGADLEARRDIHVQPVAVRTPVFDPSGRFHGWDHDERSPRIRMVLGLRTGPSSGGGPGMGTGWADGHADLTEAQARDLIKDLQQALRDLRAAR